MVAPLATTLAKTFSDPMLTFAMRPDSAMVMLSATIAPPPAALMCMLCNADGLVCVTHSSAVLQHDE